MSGPLATALAAQLAELQRWFEDRLVPEPAPSDEVVSADRYLDLDFLRAAIARAHSTQPPAQHYVTGPNTNEDEADIDLRIAVSRFTRQYASSISAVALVALARGVGLDLSARRCNVIVRSNVPFLVSPNMSEDEALRCAERPTTLPATGPIVQTLAELREYVWQRLYGENFAPLFERAREVTKVSPRLMWTNVAEWVGLVSDAADEYLSPVAAAPFVDDRIALLEAPSLPGVAGPNPLAGLLAWSGPTSDLPHGHHFRAVCCVTFYLPDRLGRLCANCPFLPAADRLALVRERHGVPMGTPGGAAERRAIEIGLDKLGIAAR
jgi:hypothetical protein